MSRTKLFLLGYFLPAWVSALLMWGDDRTSALFSPAPSWFTYFKFIVQIVSILILFTPLKLRQRPLFAGLALAVALSASLAFVHPTLEAEFILISSSGQVAVLAIFLCFARPVTIIENSDLKLLFYMFLLGFALQFALYFGLHRLPSHSIEGVFVRFNGITNDSLAVGLVIPVLIPWAVEGKFGEVKVLVLLAEAAASGSLFAVIFMTLATLGYLLYRRMYRIISVAILVIVSACFYYYDAISLLLDIKLYSVLTHLRLFLDLSGVQLEQPTSSCSEEFCESFIEAGGQLNPIYLVLFLSLLVYFVTHLFQSHPQRGRSVILNSLRIYGAAIIVASFVHPIPLIPFAIPVFLILVSLYTGERMRPARDAKIPKVLKTLRNQMQ